MISKTKYKIDIPTVEKLFKAAGLKGVANIAPLGAGEFNAVFSAKADGKDCAVKIAPAEGAPILTYEKDMMAAEVFWYALMREHTSIKVPEIYFKDFDKKQIPTEYFIMEKLPGEQLDNMKLTPAEKDLAAAEMAKMAARLHKIKNDQFGYIQNGLHGDWYQALRAMTEALMKDCAARGKKSKRGERFLKLIDTHKAVLEKAECAMINFDIWPPNILCTRENGAAQYAWIDPERTFWGDPIADFVCLEMTKPLAEKTKSLAAYNEETDSPVRATAEEKLRYAAAQCYLGLIMEVEKYYRYTPFHFGWWRNVLVCKMLFGQGFKELNNG